jgi:hypothetical protein
MFHVAVYSANTFGVNNFDLTPVSDAILTISNGHYLPNVNMSLFGGWFGGVNLTAVRLVTPTSRQVVPPPMYPIQGAVIPPDRPHVFDRRSSPFPLNMVEEIALQANIGGAANALNYAVLFMGPSIDPIPSGPIYSLHGTATTAAVTGSWTQLAITWDQTIPAGTYTIIGSVHQSTNAICHRWITKNGWYRPGTLSVSSLTNISIPDMYYGGWGSWGQFQTYTYPLCEVMCNGTDAAHDVTMNIVKVA